MVMLPHLLALTLIAAVGPAAKIAPPPPAPDVPTWNLGLAEAVRIGLARSPVVRVTSPAPGPVAVPAGREACSANVAISRVDLAASEWQFQADVSAHVRSVEQQYWALSSQQAAVWVREATLRLAEEAIRGEKDDVEGGRSNLADMAEAELALGKLKADLETARIDRATIERQFRNILGLPPEDGRKMLAATPPELAPSRPDWDLALAEMTAKNPNIGAARRALADAQSRADQKPDDAAKAALDEQKALHDQAVQAATRSLARSFANVEAEHKSLQTAQRLAVAAQQGLAAQRAFHGEGRITIDRLLDAITQYANTVAQEGLYASSYNTSLAAFEEDRGTILPYEGVQIIPPPQQPEGRSKDDAKTPAERVASPAP